MASLYVMFGGDTSQMAVCENDTCKLLWDFTLVAESPLPHNRPDITYVHKDKKEVYLIDIAVPGDTRIAQKAIEKRDKYVDLKIQIGKCWILKELSSNLNSLSLHTSIIRTAQQSVLCSSTHILRRHLSI